MQVKPATEKLRDTIAFLDNAKKAMEQIEEMRRRLESDKSFCQLWEMDSAQALRQVGINPEARTEIGKEPYVRGPECVWCITPHGNA
jgi:hypothetical protein